MKKVFGGKVYRIKHEQILLKLDKRDKEYLLSFNFNQKKDVGVKKLQIGSKTIV